MWPALALLAIAGTPWRIKVMPRHQTRLHIGAHAHHAVDPNSARTRPSRTALNSVAFWTPVPAS